MQIGQRSSREEDQSNQKKVKQGRRVATVLLFDLFAPRLALVKEYLVKYVEAFRVNLEKLTPEACRQLEATDPRVHIFIKKLVAKLANFRKEAKHAVKKGLRLLPPKRHPPTHPHPHQSPNTPQI